MPILGSMHRHVRRCFPIETSPERKRSYEFWLDAFHYLQYFFLMYFILAIVRAILSHPTSTVYFRRYVFHFVPDTYFKIYETLAPKIWLGWPIPSEKIRNFHYWNLTRAKLTERSVSAYVNATNRSVSRVNYKISTYIRADTYYVQMVVIRFLVRMFTDISLRVGHHYGPW